MVAPPSFVHNAPKVVILRSFHGKSPSRKGHEERKRRQCGADITSNTGVMVSKVIDCDSSRRIMQQLAVTCENAVHNGHIPTCTPPKERGHRGSKNRDSHRRTHLRLIIQTKTVDRCAGRGSGTDMLQENAMGVIATVCTGHTTRLLVDLGAPHPPTQAHVARQIDMKHGCQPHNTNQKPPQSGRGTSGIAVVEASSTIVATPAVHGQQTPNFVRLARAGHPRPVGSHSPNSRVGALPGKSQSCDRHRPWR